MKLRVRFDGIALLVIAILSYHVALFSLDEDIISREHLTEDIRELVKTIEKAHPDPYINGGGKIAFHRRFQEILRSVPEQGMTNSEFIELITPFVAKIKDSHTAILTRPDKSEPSPGLPFQFKIIEKGIVAVTVPDYKYKDFLGARLTAVEGVSIDELMLRQSRLRGIENQYGELALLTISFKTENNLRRLLPEWENEDSIKLDFSLPDGEPYKLTLDLPFDIGEESVSVHTKVNFPSMEKSDIVYSFLDEDKSTALLVISNMERYREGCESWLADGLNIAEAMTKRAYQYFYKTDPPEDIQEVLAAIPSATESFLALMDDLRSAGTKNLIIDLRGNTGGNSYMKEILVYFLWGDQAMKSKNEGYSIIKYSDLYFSSYSEDNLEKVNQDRDIPLNKDDYDFEEEVADRMTTDAEWNETLKKMPTFWNVYKKKIYHTPHYSPEKIYVLCTPFTFSSGFNMLTDLYSLGAKIVGTPSAQPGNNFGDTLIFTLTNSKVTVGVSFKQILTFPDDSDKGNCLFPEYMLTYPKFKSFNFDPHAEILYALEILGFQ